VTVLVHYFR